MSLVVGTCSSQGKLIYRSCFWCWLYFLPLVAYILLGKWGEFSNKKVKISELAQIAALEASRAESMAAAAVVIPVLPVLKSNSGLHQCARCSRCKSARYCSGKCQIIHWRQVHKQECQLLEYNGSCASPNSASNEEFVDEPFLSGERSGFRSSEPHFKQFHEKAVLDDTHPSCNFNREMPRKEESVILEPLRETCSTSYDNVPSKGTFIRHKTKRSHPGLPREESNTDSEKLSQNGTNSVDVENEPVDGWGLPKGEVCVDYETYKIKCGERSHTKKSNMVKLTSHSLGTMMHKSVKSTVKLPREQKSFERESMDHVDNAMEDS